MVASPEPLAVVQLVAGVNGERFASAVEVGMRQTLETQFRTVVSTAEVVQASVAVRGQGTLFAMFDCTCTPARIDSCLASADLGASVFRNNLAYLGSFRLLNLLLAAALPGIDALLLGNGITVLSGVVNSRLSAGGEREVVTSLRCRITQRSGDTDFRVELCDHFQLRPPLRILKVVDGPDYLERNRLTVSTTVDIETPTAPVVATLLDEITGALTGTTAALSAVSSFFQLVEPAEFELSPTDPFMPSARRVATSYERVRVRRDGVVVEGKIAIVDSADLPATTGVLRRPGPAAGAAGT